jgi:hypothetical protein
MFSLTPHRFSQKWSCTLAAAIAATAIAVAALAGSAFALPNDTIVKIDPFSLTDHHVQFGGTASCVANQSPSANANLDWRENVADGTVNPKLTGSLCLQSTTDTYRVALQLYVLDTTPGPGATHVLISESHSLPATGNGAAVNDFSVNLQGPKVLSAAVHHVHAQLQEQVGGVWQNVPGGNTTFSTADY